MAKSGTLRPVRGRAGRPELCGRVGAAVAEIGTLRPGLVWPVQWGYCVRALCLR